MSTPAPLSWRAAAWLADALLASPLAMALAWWPGQRFLAAHAALEAQLLQAVNAAFEAGTTDPIAVLRGLMADPQVWGQLYASAEQMTVALLGAGVALAAVFALWSVLFEGGRLQATPGKRWLGLRVETLDGGAPGHGRAALRWLGGVASALLLHAGHAMIGLRADRRALHDLMAGTRVVFTTDPPPRSLPLAAVLLLATPVVAVLALCAWMAWQFAQLAVLLAG